MLILPAGHWHAARAPRRLRAREKWLIGTALGLLLMGVIAVVISLATAGRSTGNGCIDVSTPGATGATEIYRCGGPARALCASVGVTGGPNGALGRSLTVECRKAGLLVAR